MTTNLDDSCKGESIKPKQTNFDGMGATPLSRAPDGGASPSGWGASPSGWGEHGQNTENALATSNMLQTYRCCISKFKLRYNESFRLGPDSKLEKKVKRQKLSEKAKSRRVVGSSGRVGSGTVPLFGLGSPPTPPIEHLSGIYIYIYIKLVPGSIPANLKPLYLEK